MMVLNRENRSIKHSKFSKIIDHFQKNDLLIMNDTKVFPAKLYDKDGNIIGRYVNGTEQ